MRVNVDDNKSSSNRGSSRKSKASMRQVSEDAVCNPSTDPQWSGNARTVDAPVKAAPSPPASPQTQQPRRHRGGSHGEHGRKGSNAVHNNQGQGHEDTDSPGDKDSAIDARKYKTKLCRNWQSGTPCPYGDRCVFAHGGQEMRRADDPNPYLAHQNTGSQGRRRSSGSGKQLSKHNSGSNTSSQPRGAAASTTVVVGGGTALPPPPPPPPPSSVPAPVSVTDQQLMPQQLDTVHAYPVADPPQAYAVGPDTTGYAGDGTQSNYVLQDATQTPYNDSLDTSSSQGVAVNTPYALAYAVPQDTSCGKAYLDQAIPQGVAMAAPCEAVGQVVMQAQQPGLGARANVTPLTMCTISETCTHSAYSETEISGSSKHPPTPDTAGFIVNTHVPAPVTPSGTSFRYDPYADPDTPESNFVRKVDLSGLSPNNNGGSEGGCSTPHRSLLVMPLFGEPV
eukprot:Hpha_TRINITY_DN12225_c0_g1::TRINITY_DN12225_c0_g1_i1::g.17105::m.17105